MKRFSTSIAISFGLLAPLVAITADACVVKTGKDCVTTAAHKTDHKTKLGKHSAPFGDSGAQATEGGVAVLGAAPPPDEKAPAGVTYVTQYVVQKSGQPLSPFEQAKIEGDPTMFVSALGQPLRPTDKALAMGYSVIAVPVPVLARPQPADVIHYEYYLNRNGQNVLLSDRQILSMRNSKYILPDGTLTQDSMDHGFIAIARHSYPAPNEHPVAVPNLAPQLVGTPTPQGGATPNLAPTPVNAPGYQAPGKAPPTPAQPAAPNLLPAQVPAPGYQAPGKVPPTPAQPVAPNLVPAQANAPGYQTPGQVPPTSTQPATPNLVPAQAQANAPGYQTSGQVPPTSAQTASPNRVPHVSSQAAVPPQQVTQQTPNRTLVSQTGNPGQTTSQAPGTLASNTPGAQVPVHPAGQTGTTTTESKATVPSGHLSNTGQLGPTNPISTSHQTPVQTGGVDEPHPDQLVEVYHPVTSGQYRYEDSKEQMNDEFHLIVIGFREPE